MPADNFLKIEGIKGESTDDKHKDWIEILSYNWGVIQSASISASGSGGGTTSRADFMGMSIVKLLDAASPKLFLACAGGEHIDEVTIELCRAAGKKMKYMEYIMYDVIVSTVRGGSEFGQDEPTEAVTFKYGKMKLNYITTKKDGSPGGNVPACWDLQINKKC